jgi:hypothetical protein
VPSHSARAALGTSPGPASQRTPTLVKACCNVPSPIDRTTKAKIETHEFSTNSCNKLMGEETMQRWLEQK